MGGGVYRKGGGDMRKIDKWWYFILDFSVQMIDRMEKKDADGWGGYDAISELEYRERAIKNINKGDYVDAANLCVLASYARNNADYLGKDPL
jgi:hypothetical protein